MIHSRSHLIRHIQSCPLRKCILRAMDDPFGKVENLGGFVVIPPGVLNGFIVAVTSRYGKAWYVVTTIDFQQNTIVRVIDEVPWHKWVGDQAVNELYTGDNPDEYAKKKKAVQRKP